MTILQTVFLYFSVGLLGLIFGSFFSVVVTRYPKILQNQWRSECREFLGLSQDIHEEKLSLSLPRSHCPSCKKQLKFYHNIPLFSYLCLKGKCAFCKRHISLLYPSIELITSLLSISLLWRFGLTWNFLGVLVFTYALIMMCFIDFNHQILPDALTLTTLWIGLMLNSIHFLVPLFNALWAAIIGYLLLWLSAWIFFHLRHKRGMGHGDFKMLAMVGAWLGVYGMFNTLLLSIVLGATVSLLLMLFKRIQWQHPVPFGPFIGIAAWISLIIGPFIINWLQVIPQ